MSKMKKILDNYSTHIAIPWRDVAAAQRVIFCVYNEMDELKLRAKIGEFEIITQNNNHGWIHYDLTDTFGNWLSDLKYAQSYYKKPEVLTSSIHKYLDYIETEFADLLKRQQVSEEDVVALSGVGAIFGFIKVKDLVDKLSPYVKGRLLVFFPGSFENNNYRLLDGYDGWNYHAFAITSDKEL
ncbi:BREX protein BrxB domain-containing protein [Clostridium algidicarnis]|uniref:BREX protein BrxB domain-containing protein n=1 Tax=Clostridium algidicarnis TaxID=37659 RepID=UPI0004977D0E|nr:BREX protein BrxB domain-containing protein [Clostridium algidicarnis]